MLEKSMSLRYVIFTSRRAFCAYRMAGRLHVMHFRVPCALDHQVGIPSSGYCTAAMHRNRLAPDAVCIEICAVVCTQWAASQRGFGACLPYCGTDITLERASHQTSQSKMHGRYRKHCQKYPVRMF